MGGSEVLNDYDVGNVTTYDPTEDFNYSSPVYVTITPFNVNGDAIGCGEESFATEAEPVPGCTNLTSPMNGSTNVATEVDLSWATAVGNPAGYRISVGNSSSGTQFVNNLDLGNLTSYDLPGIFQNDETIFVKITPYNAAGDAIGCTEENFSTLPCSVSLNLSNPTVVYSGTYHSNGEMTADNTVIENASDVDLISDTSVLLNGGFEVELGAELDVYIEGCPTTLTSPEGNGDV